MVDTFWLVVGGAGWWRIYFGIRWVTVGSGGNILAGGEWWWMVTVGGIIYSNLKKYV